MSECSFLTIRKFDAPIEAVWDEIYHPERWHTWWKYVEDAREVEPGDDLGLGSIWKYTWTTSLPYKLSFLVNISLVEPPFRLEGTATGGLNGMGNWLLSEEGNKTWVRYEWTVRIKKSWMNFHAPLAYRSFKWNHDEVMKEGWRSLRRRLELKI